MPQPASSRHEAVVPMLAFTDTAQAIAFYQKAFGAVEVMRLSEPGGTIGHAEIRIGPALLMLADHAPQYNATPAKLGGTTVILHLQVPNVDELLKNAVAAGATVIFPLQDQFYGERTCRIQDPFGYVWILATHLRDVSVEEMQAEMPG